MANQVQPTITAKRISRLFSYKSLLHRIRASQEVSELQFLSYDCFKHRSYLCLDFPYGGHIVIFVRTVFTSEAYRPDHFRQKSSIAIKFGVSVTWVLITMTLCQTILYFITVRTGHLCGCVSAIQQHERIKIIDPQSKWPMTYAFSWSDVIIMNQNLVTKISNRPKAI